MIEDHVPIREVLLEKVHLVPIYLEDGDKGSILDETGNPILDETGARIFDDG